MATLYTEQSKNNRKTWMLMSIFFVIVIGLGFILAQTYGNPNILYFFVIFSIGMNIASYWYSDKIVLSMANAHPASKEKYFDFYTIVENLAITAGLPMPKIYVIEDESPNAFATGRDKKHSVIAVSTGLLAIMTKTELEGVVAHEMSHIGNKDMLLATVAVVLVGLIAVISDMLLRMSIFGGSRSNDRENNGNVVMLVVGIVPSTFRQTSDRTRNAWRDEARTPSYRREPINTFLC